MTRAAHFFTLTRDFVKKQCFSKNSAKKSWDKNLYANLISCCPCPWASVAKFSSKSDHPFVSYRDDKGGTFFTLTHNFVKNSVFQQILQKKVGDGPYPKSNQFWPMPIGICCQILRQIRAPICEIMHGNHFLTFRPL